MNTRLTNTILIVLLLLNVAFVGFWWIHHGHGHKMHGNPEQFANEQDKGMDFLVKELKLDSTQKKQVENLWKQHISTMGKYQSEIMKFEKLTINCMTQDTPDSIRAFAYADSASILRNNVHKELFRHFARIRQLCNADQKKRFDEMVKKMVMKFSHHWDPHDSVSKQDSM